ncbi:ATP-binding cassette domain-containing protein [Simiduia aestuariiviva]|uniref:Sodium transport system ATP-binding protein n=1 Tax=Simiduia aestuariiviva TaxID=1510459 RepID=A0A839UM95_9GAMM|nr:ATP-binding cassette domain-containing protein [Simiduia aestuariiviva]MBB3167669.1 sodium transport system ATP-binding protein [Simiduia aestuariiviva]
MLEVRQLTKHFGDIKALDQLSFRAEDGQITGILGPNGAGKTTALRVLYGLLKTETGSAQVDDIDVAKEPLAARRKLGVFPDKFGLYERLTAFEQIAYFAGLHGLTGNAGKAATQAIIEKLSLQDIAHRRTQGFSQGQRMKVVLAQALVHQPQNFVLDEPTRGLDVMSTRILRQQLRDLRDAGHCILFSSHVMQEVAALCDQVIVVAQGRVVAAGTPEQLCEQTGQTQLEEAFVALIGSDEGIAA